MQVVVGVAIGVLAVVLLFSGIAVVVVVKKKCCNTRKKDEEKDSGEAQLIDEDLTDDPLTIQNILDDEVSVEDASGAMSHCIPILKGCHELTSRLVPITVKHCSTEELSRKVEDMARKVVPRIDTVVQLLEGPMDPRLVEARCTALYYAVSNLVLTIKGICGDESVEEWADICLRDIEVHLQVLQEESHNLRSRSLSSSMAGNKDLSSPESCSSSASTTKSSSRASTSNTDSAESGIDVYMPLEVNSNDTTIISKSNDKKPVDNHIETEAAGELNSPVGGANKQYAVAEVHRAMDTEQIELEELGGYSNRGFQKQDNPVMVC